MVVWNFVNPGMGSWYAAVIAGLLFAVPMIALWKAKQRFTN